MTRGPRPAGRPRHVPQRTCVACRLGKPKREMVRLVRLAEGNVAVDPTGKKSGRGAYLCSDPACWQAGLKRGVLVRALKLDHLVAADAAALEAYSRALPAPVSPSISHLPITLAGTEPAPASD